MRAVAKSWIVRSSVAAIAVTLLSPIQAASAVLPAADPDPSDDTTLVESRPLPTLPTIPDPADAIDTLSGTADNVPLDESGVVVPGTGWTSVPGLPVQVRTDPDAQDASPVDGLVGTPSLVAIPALAMSDPTPSGDPTPTTDPQPDMTVSEAVEVSVLTPETLTDGVVVLSLNEEATTGSPAPTDSSSVPAPSESTTPAPSASPSESPTAGPAVEPSPTDTASPSPSASPSGSPSASASESPSATEAPAPSESPAPAPDGVSASGLEVRLSYGAFAQLYGGGWGDRLVVTAYPECFLTTPELEECSTGVPVPVVNNLAGNTLTFDTVNAADLSGLATPAVAGTKSSGGFGGVSARPQTRAMSTQTVATSAGGSVYVTSGGAGNYGAIPLSPSGEWQVGQGSGEFSYSQPFNLPPTLGGAVPNLGLGYSSGSVDSMTLAENSQASPAGIGWQLSPGSISRSYRACSDDGLPAKGDLCWRTVTKGLVEEMTLSMNGRSSRLIPLGTNSFRLMHDPGWRITRVYGTGGANNNDNDNEAFTVETPDGTKYWFGYGPTAAWTVPVYGNNPGEPCYNATTANAWCQQGWQWNLDRVVDGAGNTTVYTYTRENNYYARFASTADANRTVYDKGGVLAKVEYGFRGSNTPRAVVEVSHDWRCTTRLTNPTASCTGAQGPRGTPTIWPDVPSDLVCVSADPCVNASPSFFSLLRYTQVQTLTQQTNWSNNVPTIVPRVVDTYDLSHSMPDPDGTGTDEPDLWLNKVTHTGTNGSDTITLPPVQFGGASLQNKVDVDAGERKLKHYRINSVVTETGGRIEVVYNHDGGHACDSAYVTGRMRWDTDRECFAQKYAPPGGGTPTWEWFHKYLVTRVGLGDDTMGYRFFGGAVGEPTDLAELRVFDYEYLGDPAFRKISRRNLEDDDEGWSDWRGYGQVIVHTRLVNNQIAQATDRSSRRVVVYRGLSGAPINFNGDTPIVKIATAENADADEPVDRPELQGQVAEDELRDEDANWITRSYHEYGWLVTADDAPDPGATYAFGKHTRTHTRGGPTKNLDLVKETWIDINEGGTSHTGALLGAVQSVNEAGWTDVVGGDLDRRRCTETTWLGDNTEFHRVPTSSTTSSVACGTVPTNAQIGSKVAWYYDGDDPDDAIAPVLTRGLATLTRTHTGPGEHIDTTAAHDAYGRLTWSSDGKGQLTHTTYNPADSDDDLLYQVLVDRPGGFSTTITLDPRRGLPTDVAEPNGTTRVSYNGLGQVTTVRTPGNADPEPPSIEYQYTRSATVPSRIKTITQRHGTATDSSYSFYDGWGRFLETHVPRIGGASGERVVTGVGYDEMGLARYQMGPYANTDSTTPTYDQVVNPALTNLWRWSISDFDAAGRPTLVTQRSKTLEVSKISYDYQGDRTLATPNNTVGTGGTAGRTITGMDAWGQARYVTQYQDGAATNLADRAAYTYTATGLLDTITKDLEAGTPTTTGTQTWDYDYDWAGRRTHTSDPDTGDTSTIYDANSNPTDVTVPNGTGGTRQLTTTYDVVNRPTFLKDGTKVLSSWTYFASTDPAPNKGLLKTATSHNDALGDFITSVPGYTLRGPGSVTYTYPADLLGGTGTDSKTVSYTYNDNGQLATTTLPAAADLTAPLTITHAYTTNAAPFTITAGGNTLANYIYNNHNLTTGLHSIGASPQGLRRDYTWDLGTGRLEEVKASTTGGTQALKLAYNYDNLGNPTRIAATSPQGTGGAQVTGAWCYTYDGLSRLNTAETGAPDTGSGCADDTINSELATGPRYDVAYGYLQDRLVTSSTKVAGLPKSIVTYGYDPQHPHQATGLTADHPTDSAAEPIQPTVGTLGYDNAGRVTTWTRNPLGLPGSLVAASTVTSTYDEQGNLAKTVTTNAATPAVTTETVDHAYDSSGLRIARRVTDANGNTTTTLFLGDTEITRQSTTANPQTGTNTASRMLHTQAGTPLSIQNNDGSYDWLLADQQHSVRLARHVETNSWINYQPYGNPVGGSSALPAGRGYLNKTHDPGGDVRLDHRTYSPTLNILTTPDPLLAPGDPQSANPYAYSRNNPIAYQDPSGLVCDRDAEFDSQCGKDSAGNSNGPGGGSSNESAPSSESPEPTVATDDRNWLDRHIVDPLAGCFGRMLWGQDCMEPPVTQPGQVVAGVADGMSGGVLVTNEYGEAFQSGETIGVLMSLGLFAGGGEAAAGGAFVRSPGLVARAASTVRVFGAHSADDLLRAGLRSDRNGLTAVGRALQKHANRPNSSYPRVAWGDLNATGQQVLERILADPRTAMQSYKHPNPTYGGSVLDLRLPDIGARFSSAGDFIGFL